MLARYLTGWRAVQDEAGESVPFTPEALAELLDEHAGLQTSIAVAWYASIQPKAAAHLAAKN